MKKPWKTNIIDEIARRRRSTYSGCWTCDDYGGTACRTCEFAQYLRKPPKAELTTEQQAKIRYMCAKAEKDGNITQAAAQCSSTELKQFYNLGIVEPVKLTSKATTTVFKINTTHPDVKLWWKRAKKEREP